MQSPIDIIPDNLCYLKNKYKFDITYLDKEIKAKKKNNIDNLHFDVNDNYLSLIYNNENYNLFQYHFHLPSEHSILKKKYDMEIHLVHQLNEKILVLAFFIEIGKISNCPFLDAIQMKETASFKLSKSHISSNFHIYQGSLTTPPFSENVSWIIIENPFQITQELYQNWKKSGFGKAREIQNNNLDVCTYIF